MESADSDQAAWSATVRNAAMLSLGAVLAIVGLAVGLLASWVFAIAFLVAAVVLFVFGAVEVFVDSRGLLVRYGFLRWPTSSVALDQIETATVVDVRPLRWGGWGYRGSLRFARRAAVVVRGGPGLRLGLRGGRVFVVTIDDPQTPAALLTAEVDPEGAE